MRRGKGEGGARNIRLRRRGPRARRTCALGSSRWRSARDRGRSRTPPPREIRRLPRRRRREDPRRAACASSRGSSFSRQSREEVPGTPPSRFPSAPARGKPVDEGQDERERGRRARARARPRVSRPRVRASRALSTRPSRDMQSRCERLGTRLTSFALTAGAPRRAPRSRRSTGPRPSSRRRWRPSSSRSPRPAQPSTPPRVAKCESEPVPLSRRGPAVDSNRRSAVLCADCPTARILRRPTALERVVCP